MCEEASLLVALLLLLCRKWESDGEIGKSRKGTSKTRRYCAVEVTTIKVIFGNPASQNRRQYKTFSFDFNLLLTLLYAMQCIAMQGKGIGKSNWK